MRVDPLRFTLSKDHLFADRRRKRFTSTGSMKIYSLGEKISVELRAIQMRSLSRIIISAAYNDLIVWHGNSGLGRSGFPSLGVSTSWKSLVNDERFCVPHIIFKA